MQLSISISAAYYSQHFQLSLLFSSAIDKSALRAVDGCQKRGLSLRYQSNYTANKPTLVPKMQAALIVSAVAFLSNTEAEQL